MVLNLECLVIEAIIIEFMEHLILQLVGKIGRPIIGNLMERINLDMNGVNFKGSEEKCGSMGNIIMDFQKVSSLKRRPSIGALGSLMDSNT